MPKIVGQDATVYKNITCRSCGGINAYLPKDVRLIYSGTDYGGGPDGAKGFNCAQCNELIRTEVW